MATGETEKAGGVTCPDCNLLSSNPADYCPVHRLSVGSAEQREAAARNLLNVFANLVYRLPEWNKRERHIVQYAGGEGGCTDFGDAWLAAERAISAPNR